MTLPIPRWVLAPPPDPAAVRALADELRLPEALAALLVQRDLGAPDVAKAFLRPTLDQLSDPSRLKGLPAAVETIGAAVRRGDPILVHGDYDVDGQSAAALLTRSLRLAGAKVDAFVPHRLRDGYDFGPAGLAYAKSLGARLIVTCDCGTTASDAVGAAEAAGIRVIVTDHHLCPPVLPAATAFVNPQQPGDTSGLGYLCGAGIVFKLVQALAPALGLPAAFPHYLLDYVALATVADVVPLIGENRVLVRHGLRLMRHTRWAGIQALLDTSGLRVGELRAGQIGFIVAPRLNAAGRIGEAADGLRLLLTDDPEEAQVLAERLGRLNAERQSLDQKILEEAIALVDAQGGLERRAGIVLGAEGWHPGVVGIVASRLVERYGRPAFLVCFEGDSGKGSGRSISRFNLHEALTACGELLERYGGHRMAAGLTLRRDRFGEFQSRFEQFAAQQLAPEQLGPEQRVDLEISLGHATGELERLCRHLEPCGMGNPAPVFGVRGVGFTRRQEQGDLDAIGFQLADRVPWLTDSPVDAAFRLEQNDYMGYVSLQARVLSLTPHQTA